MVNLAVCGPVDLLHEYHAVPSGSCLQDLSSSGKNRLCRTWQVSLHLRHVRSLKWQLMLFAVTSVNASWSVCVREMSAYDVIVLQSVPL